MTEYQASALLRSLGDPVRLRLLALLPEEDRAVAPVGELARRLGVSDTVVSQHLRVLSGLGLVGHHRTGRSAHYYVIAAALKNARQALASTLPGLFAPAVPSALLSARNQLVGTVVELVRGDVSTEVVIDVGGQILAAVITTSSADRMQLRLGDVAAAVFKAHDVIVLK
ncbi:MAG: metalloregulator ArsR/SmtB family transcription factor [Candidatus Dormibacteraeota bacterium]|nr:metalloregulator ArsR/SmtB family transcription factor [Candidatus Dormibacteraeota bacterium]